MLIIENISIGYKTKKSFISVIQNLSLEIGHGQALAILGPSGCGKSTLVNALAGTVPVNNGMVSFIKEKDRRTLNPKIHKIGIIPQDCGLLPWKTVKENCLLPLKIRRENITEKRKQDIYDIYKSLDIDCLLERYPKELSGGQAQRAAIARAFLLNPDLLLMDEPFSALDAITRNEAQELFLQIWGQRKPTTILVTHNIEEALYLGNTILVMGAHMGDIKYRMQNPYFGELYPDNQEYIFTKRFLREKLKPNDKGLVNFEQTN